KWDEVSTDTFAVTRSSSQAVWKLRLTFLTSQQGMSDELWAVPPKRRMCQFLGRDATGCSISWVILTGDMVLQERNSTILYRCHSVSYKCGPTARMRLEPTQDDSRVSPCVKFVEDQTRARPV
ncbi:unnamed protein product, partial [Allacma fusca]